MNGRALACVEHARLDEHVVDRAAHLAAQRVDLAYQVPLARAADGRVARHHRHLIQVQRQKQRLYAHPRRRQRRLASRVPRACYDQLKLHRMNRLR